jgi:putative membrane protein
MKGELIVKKTAKSILLAAAMVSAMSFGLFAQPAFLQEDSKTTKAKSQDDTKVTKAKPEDDKHHTANMKTDHKDHEFMTKVAESGMSEVELGQLALKQASSEDVKQFAQRMVDDHSKANEELKTLAASKSVTLPADAGQKNKAMIERMAKLSGAEFDREYMKHMVKSHNAGVALFEKEAQKGNDTETKAWAEKTLPTLREHKTMAHDVAVKVGAVKPDMKDLPKPK